MPDISSKSRPAHSNTVRCRHVMLWSPPLLFISIGLAGLQTAEPSADEFYRRDTVQTIRLTISKGNLQKMHDSLPERIYVPGNFRWGDVKLKNVGIRYKGNSSSRPEQRHKRSFLIKVNEFEKGTRSVSYTHLTLPTKAEV